MATKDEALKMAIEALMSALKLLQRFEPQIVGDDMTAWTVGLRNQLSDLQHTLYSNGFVEGIQACKEALEQPAQEPVAWMAVDEISGEYMLEKEKDNGIEWKPLYTYPAPSWQGLSDDEMNTIIHEWKPSNLWTFARAIENALKEKNHG